MTRDRQREPNRSRPHPREVAPPRGCLVLKPLIGLLSFFGPLAHGRGQSGSSRAGSLAQARKDLLVLADMPSGWTTTKNPNTTNNTLGDKQLAHCIGVPASLITENPPSVYSPQFQDAQGTLMVADNVAVFPSLKNAVAEYALGANPKMAPCMTALASGPAQSEAVRQDTRAARRWAPRSSPRSTPRRSVPGWPATR